MDTPLVVGMTLSIIALSTIAYFAFFRKESEEEEQKTRSAEGKLKKLRRDETERHRRGVGSSEVPEMKIASETHLMKPLLVSDLLNQGNVESGDILCGNFAEHGFAVLRDTDEGVNLVTECRQQVSNFFDLPVEEKSKSEVFREDVTGKRRVNRGYIPQHQKEFFKMRLQEPQENFPGEIPDLYPAFHKAVNHMNDIVEAALSKLAPGPQIGRSAKEGRWISEETLERTSSFRAGGSSLSVIRYFDMSQVDPKKEVEHVPCESHYDTGILTLIRLSEVPGLQVENRHTKEWIPIEKVGRPGDLALIMGRKINILCEKGVPLQPTLHRVQISSTVQRHSILYFFDLQTSPHD
mmetsp:Transcript_19708/g.27193  ORF Transcript_19708/g.27193 Transcript_19708/m.27193 type:complete len:351 (+) Transcript_19708:117-1169(+)|eukprot:CAMPEP_0201488306 /NCGR_PEP_ID=MMETSP0151_2-20130828/17880_1 /ASSEMBLY_ACC=CAM_ASM_000257 /TAXON_ID=200890 /ORGANISM="Paramoeba atlantica, Strain 621/1 / CCAP 1560/9" /LENGTH=350 /DNA_ID=CAMNT_0047873569 /DNA_START=123 /DNA_END=1175 /DNA_ORIENTATION=+